MRGPDTINNWEDEKLDELVARLLTGTARQTYDHLMVAVAVTNGVITVVGEGEAMLGKPMRQLFNPNSEPFLPGFIYQLPPYASLSKLTITGMFIETAPTQAWAEATGDLLAFVCGDGIFYGLRWCI